MGIFGARGIIPSLAPRYSPALFSYHDDGKPDID